MKIFKKKKKPIYNFDYKIILKNKEELTGSVVNSYFGIKELFLNNEVTEFSGGNVVYYNSNEILFIQVTNYKETYE